MAPSHDEYTLRRPKQPAFSTNDTIVVNNATKPSLINEGDPVTQDHTEVDERTIRLLWAARHRLAMRFFSRQDKYARKWSGKRFTEKMLRKVRHLRRDGVRLMALSRVVDRMLNIDRTDVVLVATIRELANRVAGGRIALDDVLMSMSALQLADMTLGDVRLWYHQFVGPKCKPSSDEKEAFLNREQEAEMEMFVQQWRFVQQEQAMHERNRRWRAKMDKMLEENERIGNDALDFLHMSFRCVCQLFMK